MATWPITRDKVRRKVRMILQDLSVIAAEQEIPDDDVVATTSNALGINTYIDSGIRTVCSELDVIQGIYRSFITLVAGQTVYALPSLAAGAYDIQDLLLSPTSGFTGNLTDQFIEHRIPEITFEAMRDMVDGGPAKTISLPVNSTPLYWCRYPRAVNSTSESAQQVQVWPPPGSTTITTSTISPLWVGPIMGLADDTTVLSLPAPADDAIAEWVAWRILAFRGDIGDSERAERRYREAILQLTGTHGSRDRLYPRRPTDVYGVL